MWVLMFFVFLCVFGIFYIGIDVSVFKGYIRGKGERKKNSFYSEYLGG